MVERAIGLSICATLAATGCAKDSSPPPSSTDQMPAAVLMSTQSAHLTAVFSAPSDASKLPAVLGGANPTDFIWMRVEFPTETAPTGPVDLANKAVGIQVAHTYYEGCDLSKGDYTPCIYPEAFTAGDPEITGSMEYETTATAINLAFDFTWIGTTSRFTGSPIYYRHGTIGSFSAPITTGAIQ